MFIYTYYPAYIIMTLDMVCTDKYYNLQPSTNDIYVVCHLTEKSPKKCCAL